MPLIDPFFGGFWTGYAVCFAFMFCNGAGDLYKLRDYIGNAFCKPRAIAALKRMETTFAPSWELAGASETAEMAAQAEPTDSAVGRPKTAGAAKSAVQDGSSSDTDSDESDY